MTLMRNARMFSYSYADSSNPKVWMEVSKGGSTVGKMVFQLYANHSPVLSENFAAFCNGSAGQSFVGTSFSKGFSGLGVCGGSFGGENVGANGCRTADENLEMRHFKRGQLTMVNDGANANGSEFMVTFQEASMLDGFNNVIGELVEGDYVLSQIEADCGRDGSVKSEYTITAAGV